MTIIHGKTNLSLKTIWRADWLGWWLVLSRSPVLSLNWKWNTATQSHQHAESFYRGCNSEHFKYSLSESLKCKYLNKTGWTSWLIVFMHLCHNRKVPDPSISQFLRCTKGKCVGKIENWLSPLTRHRVLSHIKNNTMCFCTKTSHLSITYLLFLAALAALYLTLVSDSLTESVGATLEFWHKEWLLRLETLQTFDQHDV